MKIKPSSLLLLLLSSLLSLAQLHGSQDQAGCEPDDFLGAHNAAREAVGVDPLKWDSTLEAYAKKYANERSKDCEYVHSGGPYGENIFLGFGEGYTDAATAVKFWVAEQHDYDYYNNTCMNGKECLHFTQVVWSDSMHLGCARSTCGNGTAFIVCNYDPPGNVDELLPY